MAYIEQSLSKGEEIHEIFKLHWTSKVPIVIWVILALPSMGLTLLMAFREWLIIRNLEQGVTNKRVIRKSGIITRKTDEMKTTAIESVEINQGIIGRILGYGNVKITGKGISDLEFSKIDDPMEVKRSIEGVDAV